MPMSMGVKGLQLLGATCIADVSTQISMESISMAISQGE